MNQELYWTACQTTTGREHIIRAEIEKAEHGAFVPTFVRSRLVRGRLCDREYPLIPGYVIFQTTADGWGSVSNIDGVHGVLAHGQTAKRISDREIGRLMLSHANGEHDQIVAAPLPRAQRRRVRRRRPSKRLNNRRSTISGG